MIGTNLEDQSNIIPRKHSIVMCMSVSVAKCKADDLATLTKLLTSTFNGKLVIYVIEISVPNLCVLGM